MTPALALAPFPVKFHVDSFAWALVAVYPRLQPWHVAERDVLVDGARAAENSHYLWLELRRLPQILVYCHGELHNP